MAGNTGLKRARGGNSKRALLFAGGIHEAWRSHALTGDSGACPVAPEFEKARGGS